MKAPIILALIALTVIIAAPAQASPKITLALDENGYVAIARDGTVIGTLVNRIFETSSGNWKGLRAPVEPQEGSKLEWTAKFTFPDGSIVARTTVMEVKGSEVKIESSWPTDSSAPGFGMIVLNIPEATAEDLTVEVEGKVVFRDFDAVAHPDTPGELVFRQTSTGDLLFRAKSSDPKYSLSFYPPDRARGLEFRIGGRKPVDQPISEETSLSAVFSFEE